MQARVRTLAALLPAAVAAAAVGIPNAVGAASERRADELQRENEALAAHARSAALEVAALNWRIARARADAAAARARAAAAERERAAAAGRLTIAERSLRAAERSLAERLRALYVEGTTDPLEAILSASSVESAMTVLAGLERAAALDREIVARVRQARAEHDRARATLAKRAVEARRFAAEASARADSLARQRARRSAFAAALRARRRANENTLRSLASTAGTGRTAAAAPPRAEDAARAPMPPAAPPAPRPPAPARTRTLVVSATGYALPGTTATGIPVRRGVVAVDPDVIPLGTRMTIPGYGSGVAADVGGAVQGNTIDLWFPTRAEALAWGRRTVTIVIQ